MLIQKLAYFHRDLVTQAQVVLHLRTTQVQYSMREARGLGQVLIIELEGWRDRRIQHFEFMTQHFDFAGGEVGVVGAFGTRTNQTGDAQAKFVTHGFGGLEHVGAIRIADDLHQTFAVAQINKNNATVVTAAMYPAAQADCLAHQCLVGQAAVMCSH